MYNICTSRYAEHFSSIRQAVTELGLDKKVILTILDTEFSSILEFVDIASRDTN